MLTVTVEKAQANLYQYLNQLDSGDLDKLVVLDGGAELCQIVKYSTYLAADPAGAAGVTDDIVAAYSGSPAVHTAPLYRMIKRMRNRQAGADAQIATGSITAIAGASIVDTETFTITNAAGVAKVFEFDSGGGVTGANVAVAFTGGDSAATVAAAIRAAINGVVGFGVIAAAPVGALVGLTQSDPGVDGNVAITETVANAGFLVSGFTGGTDVAAGVGGVIALKNSKNDATPRAAMVPADHAAAIGL